MEEERHIELCLPSQFVTKLLRFSCAGRGQELLFSVSWLQYGKHAGWRANTIKHWTKSTKTALVIGLCYKFLLI